MKYLFLFVFTFMIFSFLPGQKKINIVVIGAHPDDPDLMAGGTVIKFVELGHNVLFVSLTNGDAGHQSKGGGALARIRRAEAMEAGKRFGVTYKVLDNHDGELLPTLEVRHQIIRLLREWNADVVISHRPNDYHPDHRNTSILVQDAAFMVIVPNIAPDTPPLQKNPVFLYSQDRFLKPYPFIPNIAVDISEVLDKKIHAISAHESQFFEWLPWTVSKSNEVPTDSKERLEWLKTQRRRPIIQSVRDSLKKWYGKEFADTVTDAEAFEICEYGRQPEESEITELFPMIKKN